MLSERIPQWIREAELRGEARGQPKGRIQGEIETLLKQLNVKFGPLPDWVEARVRAAHKPELDLWVERILSVTNLNELFD